MLSLLTGLQKAQKCQHKFYILLKLVGKITLSNVQKRRRDECRTCTAGTFLNN